MQEAVKAGHPKHFAKLLPDPLKQAIRMNTEWEECELVGTRAQWFSKWVQISIELSCQENDLKESMPEHLRVILGPKRLLVWQKSLEEAGYPDLKVFQEMLNGTELTGEVPPCGIFEKSFKPCDITVEELKRIRWVTIEKSPMAVGRQVIPRLMKLFIPKPWKKLLKVGLMARLNSVRYPKGAILSRRFGLKQPNKVRLIDDLSGSGVNGTVTVSESPKPHTTDVVAAIALALLDCAPSKDVVGRAFDLKSAYTRMGVAKSSLWSAYVSVFNPRKGCAECFQLLAAPFGATRSQSFRFSVLPTACGTLDASAQDLYGQTFMTIFLPFATKACRLTQKPPLTFSSNFSVGSMLSTVTSPRNSVIPFVL